MWSQATRSPNAAVTPGSASPGEGVSAHAHLQSDDALLSLCEHPRQAVALFRRRAGEPIEAAFANAIPAESEELGVLPPLYPEWLGSAEFLQAHDLRFAYVAGEMARGIATVEMVLAMADARMLGFFGAAGLSLHEVEAAIDRIMKTPDMTRRAWGVNLIHSPNISGLEDALVELFLAREVRRVSASAFLALSPAVVRYAFRGVRREPDGHIRRPNHLFAKVSRIEVARKFIAPPPLAMLTALVGAGQLDEAEADLAAKLPVAEDVTAEADSGGHTDNRPLSILLPALLALRRELGRANPACGHVRIGAAGGIGTPHAVAAAFALGADYVLTGSVNQASIESGLSPQARAMLASAGITDVMMAASADMFEMGVKVQVLRRGTLFGPRANKLYELYRTHESSRCAARRDAGAVGEGRLPPSARRHLGRDNGVLRRTRSKRTGACGARSAPCPGAGVPLVSWAVQPLADQSRPLAPTRFPDMVRTGDGRFQRLDGRLFPGGAGKSGRRANRAEPARGRGSPDARATVAGGGAEGPVRSF